MVRTSTHHGLEQRALARYRALGLAPDATVIVGFSGGADSLALAALLGRIAPVARLFVLLVHVDHGLRVTSAAEAARAGELAAALRLPFVVERLQSGLRGRHPGVGIEEAARRERYLALAHQAQRAQAAVVATAHHQDDQAETVLLHLLRGSGLRGAAGMAELTIASVPWWTDREAGAPPPMRLWRPFLQETRDEVRSYAADRGLTAVEDESNADRGMRRNAVRLELLPVLERVFPGSGAALARFARVAAAEERVLEGLARAAYQRAIAADGGLSRRVLLGEEPAVQRRIVLQWLAGRSPEGQPSLDRIEAVLGLAARPGVARFIEVGRGLVAAVVDDRLLAGSPDHLVRLARERFIGPLWSRQPGRDRPRPIPVTAGDRYPIADWVVCFDEGQPAGAAPSPTAATTLLPRVAFDGRPCLRPTTASDRWSVSRRRVRDWLRQERVSPWLRSSLVCLADGDDVWWVAGIRVPEREQAAPGMPTVRVRVLRTEEVP